MPATVIGNVNFGLTAESGIFCQTCRFSSSVEQKWVRDADGDEVAGSLYNPTAEWSIEGQTSTGNLASFNVSTAFTPANANASVLIGSYSNGKSYIISSEITKSSEDFVTLNCSGVIKPNT